MKRAASPSPRDSHEEIAGLIETLRATEQRLEQLTAGEVDTVADRDGRTFLLRRAQEELRHTEAARQAAILNALPAHIAVLDSQGVILSVNEVWKRFAGANGLDDSKAGAGVNYLEICDNARGASSSEANEVAEGIRSVLGGSLKGFSIEYSCHSPTEQRWFLVTVTPLADDRRNGAIVMHLDITERTQAAARSRLQSEALNASASAIVITDRDLAIVWINAAFTELTAYTAEEAIGRNVQGLLGSGVHDAAFYKDIRDTIAGGESWSGVMTNRTRDGRLYPEAQTITPVKDSDGTISHFISIKTDLTARHLMEAQLRQSQKMEAVGQLAGGVAHEFNNLLQALMSMAAIIRLRTDQTQVAKIGGDMEVQIRRGASLTQQLLQFSRSQPIDKSDLDLGEEVRKAAILLRPIFSENLRIVVETPPERLSVEADAGQMQQVLLNFAINARDAMPDGGTLTLRAGSCDGEVFLEVEDTGRGVDEATRARMFEPFFTTKDVGKGTGLGLAVVHGIVAQHSGRVEVHSRLGKGTRLRVILPAAVRRLDPAAATADDSEPLIGTGRVLLVEDEPGVREGIEAVLEMIGYEVVAVGSGEEALALAPELAPDVLLSDVTLAGMEGPTLAKVLRGRWPDMPVVLMSGYLEASLRADVMDRGWRFLQKPFEVLDLARHLREALEDGTRQRADELTMTSRNAV